MKCDKCEVNQYEVRYSITDDKWLCRDCVVDPILETDGFGLIEKDTLESGRQVSRARLDELHRRVVTEYNPTDGSYKLRRRGENGKIQDRHPDYRP